MTLEFKTCSCSPSHGATSAHVDLVVDNNGTWEDAFQFGSPSSFNWTLVGQSFVMDIKKSRWDTTPLLTLSSSNGRIVTKDTTQRVINFNVPNTVLQASLPPGDYVYDLVMFDGSAPPIRVPLMHGKVTTKQGITNS